jgi:polar amino acid transport system ATP-binding protein
MQLVVEEVLMQKLLPAAGEAEERNISLDVEYSEREDLAQMRFSYNGYSFHPFGDEEDLSDRIIKGMSKEMEHKFVDGTNQFIISI